MAVRKINICLVSFLVLLIIPGCHQDDSQNPVYQYTLPALLDDGIEVSYPVSEGLDFQKIEEMMNAILTLSKYGPINSLLILRNNKLVLEEYFNNWNRDKRHMIQCCTKSIVSALIGITIDLGFINGLGDKLFSFFPEHANLKDPQKNRITLKHVITKTPGFLWNEHDLPYSDSNNDYNQMRNCLDPCGYVLERSMISEPGQAWYYNSGCPYLMGGVIKKRTGMQADEFARIFLFEPLGITSVEWVDTHHTGLPNTAAGLELRPRDMAKFGLLYLNKGRWQGHQIVPEKWVLESTLPFSEIYEYQSVGYASLWWTGIFTPDIHYFSAQGGLGQYIWVFPSLKMVVVFTQHYVDNNDHAREILTSYILPAAVN